MKLVVVYEAQIKNIVEKVHIVARAKKEQSYKIPHLTWGYNWIKNINSLNEYTYILC